jgi:peptidoglycan hydrolase FlgJ
MQIHSGARVVTGWDYAEPARGAKDDPQRIREAAQQFEGLLIGQMLKSMRESGGGWFGTGEDRAGESLGEFAEQQLAQVLSSQGGFGLAGLIAEGLRPGSDQPQKLSEDSARAAESSGAPGPEGSAGASSSHASVSGASTRSTAARGASD